MATNYWVQLQTMFPSYLTKQNTRALLYTL